MKRLLLIFIVALFAITSFAAIASAFTMNEQVVVAGELIAIARVPAGGLTPTQRIERINERLAYILGYERLSPSAIYLVPKGDCIAIMVGRSLLMTVTPRDAKANNTTVSKLAQEWLRNARMALPKARPTMGVLA
ncbi:MAG: hypothetical protein QHH26_02800 [Armatimonadota bacterium]|nr:hypothetical protein [Armatimonadota bacterium]